MHFYGCAFVMYITHMSLRSTEWCTLHIYHRRQGTLRDTEEACRNRHELPPPGLVGKTSSRRFEADDPAERCEPVCTVCSFFQPRATASLLVLSSIVAYPFHSQISIHRHLDGVVTDCIFQDSRQTSIGHGRSSSRCP
jgi:hypothetical protein